MGAGVPLRRSSVHDYELRSRRRLCPATQLHPRGSLNSNSALCTLHGKTLTLRCDSMAWKARRGA